MAENLRTETEGPILTIFLDRPKALNALNSGLIRELDEVLSSIPKEIRAVILTGAGEKAFVAGADIAEMKGMTPAEGQAFSELGHRVFRKLETIDQVSIAAINGFALGGGLELAMCCDLLYAADTAKLGQPEVNLAIIPGFGGTQRLARLVGPQVARELLFTGDMIDAATAKARGLVCDVLPKAELLAHAKKVALKIAAKGPLAIASAKHLVRQGAAMELDAANALESKEFGRLFGTADTVEGMTAYLEKRAPAFSGR
jgi:enoyl-CoA hydratase